MVLNGNLTVEIVQNNITEEEVDAITNGANKNLKHGAGVAGAISKAGGPSIQAESLKHIQEHGPVATGRAMYTTAGALPAKYVIHAVGPIWNKKQSR